MDGSRSCFILSRKAMMLSSLETFCVAQKLSKTSCKLTYEESFWTRRSCGARATAVGRWNCRFLRRASFRFRSTLFMIRNNCVNRSSRRQCRAAGICTLNVCVEPLEPIIEIRRKQWPCPRPSSARGRNRAILTNSSPWSTCYSPVSTDPKF